MKRTQKRSAIRENIRLAAQTRLPNGQRLLDRLAFHASLLRIVQRKGWGRQRTAGYEDDVLQVLETYYRWVERYRLGDSVEAPDSGTVTSSRIS